MNRGAWILLGAAVGASACSTIFGDPVVVDTGSGTTATSTSTGSGTPATSTSTGSGTTATSTSTGSGASSASSGTATTSSGTGGTGDGGSCGSYGCPPTFLCVNNACQCASGYIDCQNQCINPLSDNVFCGATMGCGTGGGSAGSICTTPTKCIDGSCQVYCPSGQIACGSPPMCIDPNTNTSWCGASGDCTNVNEGVNCIPGQMCVDGMCQ